MDQTGNGALNANMCPSEYKLVILPPDQDNHYTVLAINSGRVDETLFLIESRLRLSLLVSGEVRRIPRVLEVVFRKSYPPRLY
jgi:hypothetical protein